MKFQDVSTIAQEFGFKQHGPDSTGHFLLIAPGVRIEGNTSGSANSGFYSESVNRNNPLYLHTQVIVEVLNGKSPEEIIEADSNSKRIEIAKKFIA